MKTNTMACIAVALFVLPVMAADNPVPVSANAADTPGMHSKVFNPRIDAWAEGSVTSVTYDNNQFSIHGKKLPFLSAHAQMRKEFNEKMKNADAAQSEPIAAQIRQEWKDRLEKARAAMNTEAESDLKFTFAADGKVKSEADMRDFMNLRHGQDAAQMDPRQTGDASQPKLIGEIVVVQVYEAPDNVTLEDFQNAHNRSVNTANAKQSQERPVATSNEPNAAGGAAQRDSNAQSLTFRDIKSGDRIMVGFDSATEQAYMVVRRDKNVTDSDDVKPRGR